MTTSEPTGSIPGEGDLFERIARNLIGQTTGVAAPPPTAAESAATQSGFAGAGFGPVGLVVPEAAAPGTSAPGVPTPDGVGPLGIAPDGFAPEAHDPSGIDVHGALPPMGVFGAAPASAPIPSGRAAPSNPDLYFVTPSSAAGVPQAPAPDVTSVATSSHAPDPSGIDAHSALPRLPGFDPSPVGAPLPSSSPVPSTPDFYFLTPSTAATLPEAPALPHPEAPTRTSRPTTPHAADPFLAASPHALDPSVVDVHAALPRLHDFDPTPASAPIPSGLPLPTTPDFYFLTPSAVTALPRAPIEGPAAAAGAPTSLYAPVAATPPPLGASLSRRPFDIAEIRRDFPILQERVHGKPLVWLDNAATTQKPRAVLDRLVYYYEHEYSNVHRAAHTLAARSTDAYEAAREKVARFLGAASPGEIVFVRGTTEGVNLVANSWGRKNLVAGDEIILSTLEHHSNIVPWQFIAEATGAKLRIIPVTDRGEVLLSDYGKLLGPRTKLVAVTHVSNALGTILPVREMAAAAHRHGATILVDGAQAVSHFPVNVQELGADFYVLSGHKLFAPTGVGVVYGKKAILDEMEPWQGGGNMIQHVTFEKSTFADAPMRFEAGTATLADAVGLGAAVDYLERIGMDNVARHEHELLAYATHELGRIGGIRLIGTAPNKAGVVSFIADGIPAEEFGKMLDQDGIAVRAGHHCAQPTMDRFGVTSTVRPSLALYNNHEDVDTLVRSVRRILVRSRGSFEP